MKKISILIPCYNEEETLPLLYCALCELSRQSAKYVWEFLFVDDGSTDGTLSIIQQFRKEDNRCNYIELSRNFGKGRYR